MEVIKVETEIYSLLADSLGTEDVLAMETDF